MEDYNELIQQRFKKLAEISALGKKPYAGRFDVSASAQQLQDRYDGPATGQAKSSRPCGEGAHGAGVTMNRPVSIDNTDSRLPRLWRILIVAACTLILCSCQAPVRPPVSGPPGSPALPPQAFPGAPPAGMAGPQVPPVGPPGFELGVPVPYTVTGPWAPPGITKPWPQDEYLADGGDKGVEVAVAGHRDPLRRRKP